jgi:serine/threonine protein kinase
MGVALLVHSDTGGFQVCKLMKPGEDAVRFAAEVQKLESLRHPHVVEFISNGQLVATTHVGQPGAATLPAFTMAYVSGGSLRDLLKFPTAGRGRRVPVREALRITMQITEGLRELHSRGITHRDIKPENILLDIARGRAVRVSDLGIAKEQPPGHPSGPGTVIGTYGYLAPEVLLNSRVGPEQDYFAVGCVLAEMLSGERTFGTGPLDAVAHPPGGISGIEENCGATVRTLVEDLLAKDPDKRLHDPQRLMERIEGILGADIKAPSAWWSSDWPDHDRHGTELLNFAADERSWFLSGKLRWAGTLIGLHVRRRALGDFHLLLCDIVSRLRLLESSLPSGSTGRSESLSSRTLKLEEFVDSITELLEHVDSRRRVIDIEAFQSLPLDGQIFRKFRNMVSGVARSLGLTTPGRVAGSMIGPDENRLSREIDIALRHLHHCGRVCLTLIDRTERQLTDCSDQLVSLVAKIK